MIQSVIVYGFLGLSLWWFGTIAAKRERINLSLGKSTPFLTWEILIPILLFAFISGVRWKVGTDHQSYLQEYLYLLGGEIDREFEGAFMYISLIFAKLNFHFTLFFGFWALLQIAFIYLAFKDERYLLPFIGLIIVFGGYYIGWMNGIRQTIAACIFVFSIQFITKRKPIQYFLFIFLAFLFHKSAIILSVFYFIPQYNYFKNRYVNFGLLILAVIIGSSPTWIGLLNNLEGVLHLIGYEDYADKLDYLILERSKEMSLGPRRLSRIFLMGFLIWYHPQLKQIYKNTNYQVFFNFAFVGALLHNLLANTGHIFLRPTSYFTIFSIPATAYLLYFLRHKKFKELPIVYIVVLLIAISYLFIAIIADKRLGDLDWTNYKFFWDYV